MALYNPAVNPAEAYTSQLTIREARVRQFAGLQRRLGRLRLVLAAIVLVCAWLAWHGHWFSPWWILIPAMGFVAALAYHGVVRRRSTRAERAVKFYQCGSERLQDHWAGHGNRGERFADAQHVYAADLDLFGVGSLFELLCAARTRMGEETLARWLLAPAAGAEIHQRQTCIRDLRERVNLRERIALLGRAQALAADPGDLLSWAESAAALGNKWLQIVACALPVLLVASLVGAGLSGDWIPVLVVLVIEAAVLYRLKGRLQQVVTPAESAFNHDALRTLVGLLREIEAGEFESEPLRRLVGRLASEQGSASAQISRLAAIVAFAEGRRNLIVAALQVPLLYTLHVALAAERWRHKNRARLRDWLDTAGYFEALSSLAQYSFEHPDDPFPELVEGRACLRARGLGHPLLPQSGCVRNDVDFASPTRVWLVSGSNMSGKSTLLRAVGVNIVLAMAGAPVRAQALDLTALQVGASIRVNDSLREGASRFYAEITRLRVLLKLAAQSPPLLFLIDEMLQGTNSHDRRIGAEGLLQALVRHGAIGMVTTHDLALTELGGLGDGILRNMHFEDRMEDGRMHFDFKLRTGVVARSNGLALMRAIGIDV